MSKQEATRLADALDDSFCPLCHQAAAMLRQWPEAGGPVAWISAESVRRLRSGGNGSRGTVPVHATRSMSSHAPLYAAQPDQSERIAALEAERDQYKMAAEAEAGFADQYKAKCAALEAENAMLRAELRKMPKAKYVAAVTDCEACLTPDACAIRGQCAHYLRTTDNAAGRIAALEAALAERDRVIDAAKEALWVCAEHNALYHGEQHNTVTQARAALRAIEEVRK